MSSLQAKFHKGKSTDLNNEGKTTEREFITAQPLGPSRVGLDVISNAVTLEGAVARVVEAGSTARKIVLTGHGVYPGDVIRVTASANGIIQRTIFVENVIDANQFLLVGDVSDINGDRAEFVAGDTIDILRPNMPVVSAGGGFISGPLTFTRDGVDQTVIEDTGTPANNRPLPVKLTGVTGDISITANDLDISSDHANDSISIGDGTLIATVKAGAVAPTNLAAERSLRTSDFYVYDALLTIDTVLDGILADTAVLATEATLAAQSAKLPASLGIKADAASFSVTQSTEDRVVQAAIRTAVETLDNAIAGSEMQVDIVSAGPVATETTLAAMSGKLPASLGIKADAGSLSITQSTEDRVITNAIKTAVETIDNAIAGSEMQVDIVTATTLVQTGQIPATLGAKTSAASLSVTPATDAEYSIAADNVVDFTRLDFSSSNVTDAAYTELISDIGATAGKKVTIFVASGDPLYLAIGAASSESDVLIIPPGGFPHPIEVAIPANGRLSLKRVLAGTTSVGSIIINVLG